MSEENMRCSFCAHQLAIQDRFCGDCGRPLDRLLTHVAPPRMEFPIYAEFVQATVVVVPNFIKGLEIPPRRYLEMLAPTFVESSVINATSHAEFWLERDGPRFDDWARLPRLIAPNAASRFVEVDLRTADLLAGPRRATRRSPRLPIGWAAQVTPVRINPGDNLDPWVPIGAATQLFMDIMVKWTEGQPTQVPVAQVYMALDPEGRAMMLAGHEPSYWVVALYGDDADIQRLQAVLPPMLPPLVMALAEEHGALPVDLRPKIAPPASPLFPIRAAIEARRFTLATSPLETPDEEDQAALQGFADRVMAAQPFDASAEAHQYLLEEQNPSYDWTIFPSLIPPAPSIYIEVEPPDRVLKEDSRWTPLGQIEVVATGFPIRRGENWVPSRVIPFSRLVGAGVGWSALVLYHHQPPTAHFAAAEYSAQRAGCD